MKKKLDLGKKLSLNKEKLNRLNEEQLSHFLGGRMAATTGYTSGGTGTCSNTISACCSVINTGCCA